MAENETLDLWGRHSGRWRQLLRKIEQGEPPDEVAEEAVRCLCKTFGNLIELFLEQDVPLRVMLDAAKRNDGTLRKMARRCRKGRDYAELLQQMASVHRERNALMRAVMRETVGKFLDQIEVKLVGRAGWPDFARFRILEYQTREAMKAKLEQLADRVAEQPDRKPRMPGRSAVRRVRDAEDIMHTSILPRSGTHG